MPAPRRQWRGPPPSEGQQATHITPTAAALVNAPGLVESLMGFDRLAKADPLRI